MDIVTSPLTGKTNVEHIGDMSFARLRHLYKSWFNVDSAALKPTEDRIGLYRCRDTGLQFFHPLIVGDGKFYEELQVHDWYYDPDKPEYTKAAEFIPEGATVLEVGGGEGHFSTFIPGRSYTGLEFNAAAVEKSRARGLDVRMERAETLSAAGQRFDVVCSFQVLEHVDDPAAFIAALASCVRPGGRLVLGVPHGGSYLTVPGPHLLLNCPPHHQTWWTPETFFWLQAEHGWRLLNLDIEAMREDHRGGYVETLIWRFLRALIGKKPAALEIPDRDERSLRLARWLSDRLHWRLFPDTRLAAPGHALLAVFEIPA